MEKINVNEQAEAAVLRRSEIAENMKVTGKYIVECFDKDGNLKWKDHIDNLVTNVGVNQLFDGAFGSGSGSSFLGLISSIGYTGVNVLDTMGSHSGWNEAGNGVNYPNWSTPASNARGAITWAAATGKAKTMTGAISFVIATNGGTVKGCFVVFGTGAVATNNNTSGVLYSAGLFSGGDKVVAISDTIQANYTTSA